MPKFNNSIVDPKPTRLSHKIYKTFASALAGILYNGVHAFLNYKKTVSSPERYEKVLTRWKVTEVKIDNSLGCLNCFNSPDYIEKN